MAHQILPGHAKPQVRTWTCIVAQVIGLNKLGANRERKKGRIEGERHENMLRASVSKLKGAYSLREKL